MHAVRVGRNVGPVVYEQTRRRSASDLGGRRRQLKKAPCRKPLFAYLNKRDIFFDTYADDIEDLTLCARKTRVLCQASCYQINYRLFKLEAQDLSLRAFPCSILTLWLKWAISQNAISKLSTPRADTAPRNHVDATARCKTGAPALSDRKTSR